MHTPTLVILLLASMHTTSRNTVVREKATWYAYSTRNSQYFLYRSTRSAIPITRRRLISNIPQPTAHIPPCHHLVRFLLPPFTCSTSFFFFFLYISLSLSLSLSLSVSICLCLSVSVSLSLCLSLSVSRSLSVSLSLCL